MAIPSRFTKVKIAAGYTLLLVVLLFSLLFVHRGNRIVIHCFLFPISGGRMVY